MERTLGVSGPLLLAARPAVRRGCAVQASIWSGLENLQGQRQHSLAGPCPSARLYAAGKRLRKAA